MKTEQKNKGSVTGGLFWSFLERIASQLVSTIVGIILARLLSPDEYGIIAIVMIFITLSDVFVTSGFGTALVQKKEIHKKRNPYEKTNFQFIYITYNGNKHGSSFACNNSRSIGL